LLGIVGGADDDGTTNSFSNDDDIRYHGTDKDGGDFTKKITYSGGLGWIFHDDDTSAPWTIDEGVSYPYFYWQKQGEQ
jgi:hypothetical protein